jgi:hypothetical protein
MRLAVVSEPRHTEICSAATDKHWSQRVNGSDIVHCVSWRNHWAKGLHLSQCWMYARLHNWTTCSRQAPVRNVNGCQVPRRGNDPWVWGGQPTPRMTKVNWNDWVVPGDEGDQLQRKTTKD